MQTNWDQGEPIDGTCLDPNALNPRDRKGEVGRRRSDDSEDLHSCALLDSGATTDLMTSAYAEAWGFNIRPITELSKSIHELEPSARAELHSNGVCRVQSAC